MSDLYDGPDECLKYVQENGWPQAEWVRFSTADPSVVVIEWMFAGEVCTAVVPRRWVTDLASKKADEDSDDAG